MSTSRLLLAILRAWLCGTLSLSTGISTSISCIIFTAFLRVSEEQLSTMAREGERVNATLVIWSGYLLRGDPFGPWPWLSCGSEPPVQPLHMTGQKYNIPALWVDSPVRWLSGVWGRVISSCVAVSQYPSTSGSIAEDRRARCPHPPISLFSCRRRVM